MWSQRSEVLRPLPTALPRSTFDRTSQVIGRLARGGGGRDRSSLVQIHHHIRLGMGSEQHWTRYPALGQYQSSSGVPGNGQRLSP